MTALGSVLPTDDSGYAPSREVLKFLEVSDADIDELLNQSCPLGITRDEYEAFKDSLDAALKSDGVYDADVRLQGSSAHFFSGKHKTMPVQIDDVLEVFIDNRGRAPSGPELGRIMDRIRTLWPTAEVPRRRPFDSLYRLRVDRYPSDIDVQVSSQTIFDRATDFVADLGIPIDRLVVENAKYSFIRKEYVAEVSPALTSWALRQSDTLPRPVTVAAFAASGPRLMSGAVSSHFKSGDWKIFLGGGGE